MRESPQNQVHQCNGQWQLIPELSFYQEGEPPLCALYEISVIGNEATFKLSWKQHDGKENSLEFGGIADSAARELGSQKDASAQATPRASASYTIVDDQTLDSAVFVDDVEVAYARRVVSNDNGLMSVLQSNATADGSRIRITQVYRRVA